MLRFLLSLQNSKTRTVGSAISLTMILFIIGYLVFGDSISKYSTNNQINSKDFIRITLPRAIVQPKKVVHTIEISQVEYARLEQFATNDYNPPIFNQNGISYEIVHQGSEISHIQLSPDKKRFGFYNHRINKIDNSIHATLVIMNVDTRFFKETDEGVLKVSNWEWRDQANFTIYINCGSSCHLAHDHSLYDGTPMISPYLVSKP